MKIINTKNFIKLSQPVVPATPVQTTSYVPGSSTFTGSQNQPVSNVMQQQQQARAVIDNTNFQIIVQMQQSIDILLSDLIQKINPSMIKLQQSLSQMRGQLNEVATQFKNTAAV